MATTRAIDTEFSELLATAIENAEIGELPRSIQVESTVGAPILVESRLWGACIAATRRRSSWVEDAEARLVEFTELVATAIANAKSPSELAASRRRIVAASDAARRRIERDLHDGVQQQLISLGLHIAALEAGLPAGDELTEDLENVRNRLRLGLEALGEIARGIHPAILRHGGLAPALGALARGSRVPVALDARIDVQLPEEVEVAAYYVVSEALTNVTKHARASGVHIDVSTDHPALTLVVRDDGIGGAAVGDGSGLVGLQDRVEALGGKITVDSPPGRGTSIVIALPTASEPSSLIESALGPPNEA